MSFSSTQQKEAYKKLPPHIQDLAMSNETTDLITDFLKSIDLDGDQLNSADSEILYALLCLQSLDDAINNIVKSSGKSIHQVSPLKSIIQDNILNKYTIDIREFIEANKGKPVENDLPVVREEITPVVQAETKQAEAPIDLPIITPGPKIPELRTWKTDVQQIEKTPPPPPPRPVNHYPQGKDPYREIPE